MLIYIESETCMAAAICEILLRDVSSGKSDSLHSGVPLSGVPFAVVICDSAEDAQDYANFYSFFSKPSEGNIIEGSADRNTEPCDYAVFLPRFNKPYSLQEIELKNTAQRINALDAIFKHKKEFASGNYKKRMTIFTTITALIEPITPFIEEHSLKIAKGEHIIVDKLLKYLLLLGYERVPTVRSLGEFGVRGSVIDISKPNKLPSESEAGIGIRIYIDGDIVEKILAFDLQSQMPIGIEYKDIDILPVSEIILDDNAKNSFTEYYHSEAMSDNINDGYQIYDLVRQGVLPYSSEHLYTMFYPQSASLLYWLNSFDLISKYDIEQSILASYAGLEESWQVRLQNSNTLKLNKENNRIWLNPKQMWVQHARLLELIKQGSKVTYNITTMKDQRNKYFSVNARALPVKLIEKKQMLLGVVDYYKIEKDLAREEDNEQKSTDKLAKKDPAQRLKDILAWDGN